MELLCARAADLTRADGAAFALMKDGALRLGASHGEPDHPLGEELELDGSLAGLAIRDRRSLLCRDAQKDPRVNRERVARTGVRSMVAVPLLHADRPVGTLLVLSREPDAFDQEDVRTLELLSLVMSSAMSHAAALQAKRQQMDALTRSRTIFEGASVGIVRAGPDRKALEVNSAVLQLLGFTPEEHQAHGLERFTHPDDVAGSRRCSRS